MTVGASIVLLALGAILAFAVGDQQVGSVDVEMIGFILMGAGILGLLLSLVLGRRTAADETIIHEDRRI